MYIIFSTAHAMSNMNNIYQFEVIWRTFMRVRECWTDGQTKWQSDGQTDGQRDKYIECINTSI